MVDRLIQLYKKIFSFITHDIWHIGPDTLSKRYAFWVRQLKILLFTIKEFDKKNVNQQAASLTLYSLLTLVPIAALIFAVSKGFGIDEQLTEWLNSLLPGQQGAVERIIQLADSAIQNAKGGWIAGIGLTILLWTSLNMFVQVETAFNLIWQTKRSRPWARRIADYMSTMLIIPVLLLISSSVTISLEYFIKSVDSFIPVISISPFLFTIIPFIAVWILFTIIYIVMPNIKVKFVPALVAGIIAGTAFQVVEQLYFFSQVSIARYNVIYGSLAAIPLFLFSAKMAWQIVLLGAELSFAYQNIDSYELELNIGSLSHSNTILLTIYVLQRIVKNFKAGKKAETATELAHNLSISVRAVRMVSDQLIECNILAEISNRNNEKEKSYMPALDTDTITIAYVVKKLEEKGKGIISSEVSPEMERLKALMENLSLYFDKNADLKLTDI